MKIYFIGFMGAGKTSKGKALAKKLGFKFADMDHIIEEQEGMSVRELFSLKGEEWFRNKETAVLHELGKIKEDIIISTGGGAPCYNNNMEFINSTGVSVYLKLSPQILAERLFSSGRQVRPLLDGKTPEALLEYIKLKLGEREAFYQQSIHIVPAENLGVDELLSILQI